LSFGIATTVPGQRIQTFNLNGSKSVSYAGAWQGPAKQTVGLGRLIPLVRGRVPVWKNGVFVTRPGRGETQGGQIGRSSATGSATSHLVNRSKPRTRTRRETLFFSKASEVARERQRRRGGKGISRELSRRIMGSREHRYYITQAAGVCIRARA